jgi:hypothetical protein
LKERHFDDTDDIRSNTTENHELYNWKSEGHSTKPVPKLFW